MKNFRDHLRTLVPPWLSDRPTIGKTNGFRLLYSYAAVLDACMQAALEGIQSNLPTLGPPSALPYMGRDRGIERGPQQTEASYRTQLARFLEVWRKAGNAWSVAVSLQRFLGDLGCMVRVVNRDGFWTTLHPDGSLSFKHGTSWDWDSVTHPARASRWWDVWVIVYQPHFADAGNWGAADTDNWGDDEAFGLRASGGTIQALKALFAQWKGAHTHPQSVIFTYDAASFDPADPTTYPTDGTWGNWSKRSGGSVVPARFANARYVEVM